MLRRRREQEGGGAKTEDQEGVTTEEQEEEEEEEEKEVEELEEVEGGGGRGIGASTRREVRTGARGTQNSTPTSERQGQRLVFETPLRLLVNKMREHRNCGILLLLVQDCLHLLREQPRPLTSVL